MLYLYLAGGNKIDNICLLIHRFLEMKRTWVIFEFFFGDLNIDALHCHLIKYISCLTLK